MLSIIIPTYNEAKNLPELISCIDQALSKEDIQSYEVLVMDDDSPDGSAQLVTDLEMPHVRSVNRKGRPRGLANAVIDGFHEAKGDVLAVMDADLSHPPRALPNMYCAIENGMNLVVGSRYVRGGGVQNWPFLRRLSSHLACLVAKLVTPIKDATSGFFMVRKSSLDGVRLDPLGFKIGLEVFVKARHEGKVQEVPYIFEDRKAGQSKLTGNVIVLFFRQILGLLRK